MISTDELSKQIKTAFSTMQIDMASFNERIASLENVTDTKREESPPIYNQKKSFNPFKREQRSIPIPVPSPLFNDVRYESNNNSNDGYYEIKDMVRELEIRIKKDVADAMIVVKDSLMARIKALENSSGNNDTNYEKEVVLLRKDVVGLKGSIIKIKQDVMEIEEFIETIVKNEKKERDRDGGYVDIDDTESEDAEETIPISKGRKVIERGREDTIKRRLIEEDTGDSQEGSEEDAPVEE